MDFILYCFMILVKLKQERNLVLESMCSPHVHRQGSSYRLGGCSAAEMRSEMVISHHMLSDHSTSCLGC